MVSKSQQKRTKVQKDKEKNARPTKVHEVKPKRVDKFDGKIYDDWFEQDIAILASQEEEGDEH